MSVLGHSLPNHSAPAPPDVGCAARGDPVQVGLVKSLQRPDGNLTGVSDLNVEVASKRLEVLRELVPRANRFALLVNPANSARAETVIRETEAAASGLGVQLEFLNASTESELDAVFAKISSLNVGGLVIGADAFSRRPS